MVKGYYALARSVEAADRGRAAVVLRKAVRLDPAGPMEKALQSRLLYIEALDLMGRGIIDQPIVQKAVELDPTNDAARALLRKIEEDSGQRITSFRRAVAVGAAGIAAVLAGIALLWRRRARASS
jgi:uncharacterized membrane-anchored protein